jgi:hypothetical protein
VDGERADNLRKTFGKDWSNPHLYDLMISSRKDEESTAEVILNAMMASSRVSTAAAGIAGR